MTGWWACAPAATITCQSPMPSPSFSPRVEALCRRGAPHATDTLYKVGELELDRLAHRVTRGGKDIPLQPREFRLLEYLMRHAGQVVTRTMLLENVWDYHFDPQTNVIDVHVSRLRSKVDKGFDVPMIIRCVARDTWCAKA